MFEHVFFQMSNLQEKVLTQERKRVNKVKQFSV